MNYRIPAHILLQQVGDEKVILDPDSGVYFTLDAVGARMLDLLAEIGEPATVLEAIVTEYEVKEAQASDDLNGLIAQLCEHGLLEGDVDDA